MSRRSGRTWLAFGGFAVVAGFLLVTEHRAHVFGALPYLFLLMCPLFHLFGHGGHGHHDGGDSTERNDSANREPHDHSAAVHRDGGRGEA